MEPKKGGNKGTWRVGWTYIMLENIAAVSVNGKSEGGWSRWIRLDMRIAARI